MANTKCPRCGEVYDSDNPNLVIRHEQGFCLTIRGKPRKNAKPKLSIKDQWIADRKKGANG
jgi:hypothetical protein